MKLKIKKWHFNSVKSIQAEQQMLNMIRDEDFQKTFETWRKRWNRCINVERNFEGDRDQI